MSRHWHVVPRLGGAPLQHCGSLLLGSALLLPGCTSRNDEVAAADAFAATNAPLSFTINSVQSTRRLATSTMERREAAAGNRFVVLDVSVTNPGPDPQALVEGRLIAMSESEVQSFDTPVTLFSDDYLSVQVLQPGQRVRGKVAYEVPAYLPGVLYWNPGSSGQRILLHPDQTQERQRTFANVGVDDTIQPARVHQPGFVRRASTRRAASESRPIRAKVTPAQRIPIAKPMLDVVASRMVASAPRAASGNRVTPSTVVPLTEARAGPTGDAPPLSPMDRFVAKWVPSAPPPRASACDDASRASRLVCSDAALSAMDIQLGQSVQRAGRYVDPTALHSYQAQWAGRVRNACETVDCLQQAYVRQQAQIDALIPTGR